MLILYQISVMRLTATRSPRTMQTAKMFTPTRLLRKRLCPEKETRRHPFPILRTSLTSQTVLEASAIPYSNPLQPSQGAYLIPLREKSFPEGGLITLVGASPRIKDQ